MRTVGEVQGIYRFRGQVSTTQKRKDSREEVNRDHQRGKKRERAERVGGRGGKGKGKGRGEGKEKERRGGGKKKKKKKKKRGGGGGGGGPRNEDSCLGVGGWKGG